MLKQKGQDGGATVGLSLSRRATVFCLFYTAALAPCISYAGVTQQPGQDATVVVESPLEINLLPNLLAMRYESTSEFRLRIASPHTSWQLVAAYAGSEGTNGGLRPDQVMVRTPGGEWQDLSEPRLVAYAYPGSGDPTVVLKAACTQGATNAPGTYRGTIRLYYRPNVVSLDASPEAAGRPVSDLSWTAEIGGMAMVKIDHDTVRFSWNGQTEPIDGDRKIEIQALGTYGHISIFAEAEPLVWRKKIPPNWDSKFSRTSLSSGGNHPTIDPSRLFIRSSTHPEWSDPIGGPGYRSLGEPAPIFDPKSPTKATISFRLLVNREDHAGSYVGKVFFRVYAKP